MDETTKVGKRANFKRYGYIAVGTVVTVGTTVWFEGVAHAGNSLRRLLGNSL